jgi:hypothetical protein
MSCGLRVPCCELGERFNGMKNRRITKFDFMHSTRLDLRGENGRQIQKIDLMVVSAVKRAAEGEIYNVTLF